MWLTLGMAGAGALKGIMDAKANQRKAKEHDKYRKAAMEHSYWTGLGDVGEFQGGNQSVLGGILSGGLTGASTGASIASLANAANAVKGVADTADAVSSYQGIGPSQTPVAEQSFDLVDNVDFTKPVMGPALPDNYSPTVVPPKNIGPMASGSVYAKMLNPNIGMQVGRHSEIVQPSSGFSGGIAEPMNMYDPTIYGPYGQLARR